MPSVCYGCGVPTDGFKTEWNPSDVISAWHFTYADSDNWIRGLPPIDVDTVMGVSLSVPDDGRLDFGLFSAWPSEGIQPEMERVEQVGAQSTVGRLWAYLLRHL